MSDARLDTASAALERALAARPHLDGYALTDATKAMCALRDELRLQHRASPADSTLRARLEATNLVIALLLAGHFPLGDTPWAQLEGLRGQIEALRDREPA